MTRRACPSTEQTQAWWTQMQAKGATKLYAVKDGSIYRLRAFTDNRKKCGEFSLGLRDKRLANRIVNSIAVTLDDDSPASVISKYIELKQKHAQTCREGKYATTSSLAASTEHSISTIKSRFNAHLIPFCRKQHITNIKDMFRREIISSFMDELYETVAISETSKSVMSATLALLRWYNNQQKTSLIDRKFDDAIKNWRSFFGDKRSRPKTFLRPEQIQAILHYDYPDDRTKAMFLFPLVCGLHYNEYIHLRWKDLNAKDANMQITVAKGGKTRMAQYPRIIQTFLTKVRLSRNSDISENDLIFKGYNQSRDLATYKALLQEITGSVGKDSASNCLRRSGCDLLERYKYGFGERQLGHTGCSKYAQRSYFNESNYEDVNAFWDAFYANSISTDKIIGIDNIRLMAIQTNGYCYTTATENAS